MTTEARQALIDGKHVPADDVIDVLNPSTGGLCARIARGGGEEIDLAVASASNAFEDTWRHTSPADRAATCRRIADVVRAHRSELADLETLDTGKPLSQALVDADVTARYFDFYAGCTGALFGDTLFSQPEVLAYTLLEPYGVSGHIIPWNYPMQVVARTIAPALAAGNTCVLKPAEDAPLTPLRISELALEAGLPPGVLNVVPGYGEEAGAALSTHPGVDHLSFTGSREVGTLVMANAAANIVPVTLELGGKSPHLLFPDFELAQAIPPIVSSITEHAGQNCSAGSRLLVHESVHEAAVAALVKAFEQMRIGAGETDPDLGPLISAKQRARVLEYVEHGKRYGRLATGGGVPDSPELKGGFFVEPAIIDDAPQESRAVQEEIFGPVLCVTPFRDVAEAVELANGTSYGLAAGVWTRDVGLAHHLIRELRMGQVFVNNYSAAGAVELPFGGYKRSGFGREKGFEALREYSQCKSVAVRVDPPSACFPQ